MIWVIAAHSGLHRSAVLAPDGAGPSRTELVASGTGHAHMVQRTRQTGQVDAVIVGAGFAGLYLVHRLRGLGLSVLAFETGDGVGGTWFWNRYPGARCDVESMQYSFSFSPELQQDWDWSERYSAQPEICAYLNHVADRFDLRRDIRFETTVTAAAFDEDAGRWSVETNRGDRISAAFLVMATGCLSAARMPVFEGMDSFRGRILHTGHWPKEEVSFVGRRVAVIGTGSSGIQVIPRIAEQAAHLTVMQRTANFSIPAWNRALSADAQAQFKKDYDAYREKARNSRSGILYEYARQGTFEVDEAARETEYERRWRTGGANFTHCFNDVFVDEAANALAAEFVRGKIREIVKDPETAEALSPRAHAIGTKRICVDTDYYATFNRDNVSLVDIRKHPIDRFTPAGIQTAQGHHDLNDIVLATGFDAVTGAILRIDITGADGARIADAWAEGPRSYLGLMVAGFPNLFTVTGPGSPSILTNVVVSIEQHVDWIADCLATMRDHGQTRIDADPAAQDTWVGHVREVAERTLFTRTASWYMGANVPGKPRVFLPYVGGFQNYSRICDEVVRDGYRGFVRG
jgi:cyclohexanone monooxygenase